MAMNRIGWIGTGQLGVAIASSFCRRGYSVFVNNRTESKAQALISLGAKWCGTPAEVARQGVTTVFTCLSGEEAFNTAVFGKDGLLSELQGSAVVIDLATRSPEGSANSAKGVEARGFSYVACPVSGGAEGARAGKMVAIVAGLPASITKVRPLLEVFCYECVTASSHANAQKLKILNNLAEAINLAGAMEVIQLGIELGVETKQLSEALSLCRGRSPYMDIALNYVFGEKKTTNVSLAVRMKDINLAKKMMAVEHPYVLAETAAQIYVRSLIDHGPYADQCSIFQVAHPTNSAPA